VPRTQLTTFAAAFLALQAQRPAQAAEGWLCVPDRASAAWTCTADPASTHPSAGAPPAPTGLLATAGQDASTPQRAPASAGPPPASPADEEPSGYTAQADVEVPPPAPAPPGSEPADGLHPIAAADPRSPWRLCPDYAPPGGAFRPLVYDPNPPVRIQADASQVLQHEQSIFLGNVYVRQGGKELWADSLRYHLDEDTAEVEGEVAYREAGLTLWASRGFMDFAADTGFVEGPRFRLDAQQARGHAKRAELLPNDVSRYEDGLFTYCAAGSRDWLLKASEITLDRRKGVGSAKHARLWFKGVPIAYTPYASFPIDDRRKSGLLAPTLNFDSGDGYDVAIPYYWNIAPHRDATFTPRLIRDRGWQLRTELRFLNPTNAGELDLEYLPNDKLRGDDRAAFSMDYTQRLTRRLSADVDLNYLTDEDYLRDLGTSLATVSQTQATSRARLAYRTPAFTFTGLVQQIQTLDPDIADTAKPYQIRPKLRFDMPIPQRLGPLDLAMRGEAVRFAHDDRVNGTRVDLEPSVALPLVSLSGYVTPKVALRHTRYQLEDGGPDQPESPSRTVPIASLDTGLFVERSYDLFGGRYVHTLEPRLFYLYKPKRAQDDIPLFDTADFDFSFPNLFRESRFSGADRVGDDNALTVALTSRLLDDQSGREVIRGSIGQRIHFADRQVTLSGVPNRAGTSPVVVELGLSPTRYLSLAGEVIYDALEGRTDKGSARLHLEPDRGHVFNLSHRFRRGDLEQVDVSGLWAITPRWKAVARWNYSLAEDLNLEILGGLQYESCCWSVMLARRVHRNEADRELGLEHSFFVQFVLKGLGRYGNPLEDLLERGILGYETPPIR
jgi:LPS-assembly protein